MKKCRFLRKKRIFCLNKYENENKIIIDIGNYTTTVTVGQYKDEKIIWYLESCDLNLPSQTRAIWQLKNAGWFKNVAGFNIGRPLNSEKMFGSDYKQANYMHLKDFNVPVVIDADFGHLPPSVHMINGAVATIKVKDGKGEIKYDLI